MSGHSFPVLQLTDDQKAWIVETTKLVPFDAHAVRITLEFCEGDEQLAMGLLVTCGQLARHPYDIIAWCHGRI